MRPTPVTTRSDLLGLLTEASELEHGLSCAYLFAAFSLKQHGSEGLSFEQLQLVRKWAAQIYFVASQEMLHLAQAWNLMTAIGGTPYYLRPNFPQSHRYYPLDIPLVLEGFSLYTLERFLRFEEPTPVTEARAASLATEDLERPFRTIGELYAQIRAGFEAMPEEVLFLGASDAQVGPQLVDFPDLVRVTNRATAIAAIERITLQGEGVRDDRVDCHYGIFRTIVEELGAEERRSLHTFAPARAVVSNPATRRRPNGGAGRQAIIVYPFAQQVSEVFDGVYATMLRLLSWSFSANADVKVEQAFARAAILLMVNVVKPLGEALAQLPFERASDAPRAGAGFGLSRHLPFPASSRIASKLASERLEELCADADRLAADLEAPPELLGAARGLRRAAGALH